VRHLRAPDQPRQSPAIGDLAELVKKGAAAPSLVRMAHLQCQFFFVCVILIFRDGGSELDQVHAYLVSTYALFFSVFPVQRSTLVATIAYRFFRELTTFRVYAALANLIATTFAILYMLRGSAVSVFLRETLLELFFLFF
jgi:hypothetical protein